MDANICKNCPRFDHFSVCPMLHWSYDMRSQCCRHLVEFNVKQPVNILTKTEKPANEWLDILKSSFTYNQN